MFEDLLKNVKPLNYPELNGKHLMMKYLEDEEGYGLLAGQDSEGKIYILHQVRPAR